MAVNIDFITSNPADDAFQKAEKLALDTARQDQLMRASIREEKEKETSFPTRMRQLEAQTSSAETKAQTDKAEAPYAGPMAATKLRQAKATAANTELMPFYRSVELLEKGDIDGARAVAAQAGLTIPDEYVQDAELRREVASAAKEAQTLYDKRPKDQQAYIKGRIAAAIERRQNGQRASDPAAAYDAPGAPEPQETTDFRSRYEALSKTRVNPETGKEETGYVTFDRSSGEEGEFRPGTISRGGLRSAGAGANASSATERIIGELMKRGHTYEESLALAKRAPNADQVSLRKESMALSAAKADTTNYLTNPAQTIKKYREMYGLGSIESGPAPAPSPSPTPSNIIGPNETITDIKTTPAPNPSPQAQSQMSPGDGTKPVAIQAPPLPPSLPQGVQYSWSPARRQFRDELGRVYDEQGRPVS